MTLQTTSVSARDPNLPPDLVQDLYAQLQAAKEEITRLNKIIESLNEEVYLDELTKIYNRKHLNKKLKKYYDEVIANHLGKESAPESAKTLSLIIIDLNGFKEINDKQGHEAGDEALRKTAQTILACVRGGDDVCRQGIDSSQAIKQGEDCIRHGGDEYCILLPNVSQSDAENIACRIAQALKEIDIFASIGIGTLSPETIEAYSAARYQDPNADPHALVTASEFFDLVDVKAMYDAKKRKEEWLREQERPLAAMETFITSLTIKKDNAPSFLVPKEIPYATLSTPAPNNDHAMDRRGGPIPPPSQNAPSPRSPAPSDLR